MRLLLDEMISATVAIELRTRGYDVLAVQDTGQAHLRGIDDCLLLAEAAEQQRAVVTDNVADFIACHERRQARGDGHHGLLLFTNDTFPRHRHDLFVGQVIAVLARELDHHPENDPSGWIRWLRRSD